MMSDLISRKAVLDIINRHRCDTARIEEGVINLPTAYDVDKVVEELKRMSGIQFDGCNESYELNWCISTDSAVEIVKGAVKGE